MLRPVIRAHADARSETLKYRIADGVRMKVPYLAVIGKREAESDMVAINVRGAGKEQKPAPVSVDAFIARVVEEARTRSLTLGAGVTEPPRTPDDSRRTAGATG